MLTLLSFSPNHLEFFKCNTWEVDALLQRVDRTHNIWFRCIHLRDRTAIARIVKCFDLNPSRVDMIFNRFPKGIDEDLEDCFFDNYEVLVRQIKQHDFEVACGSFVVGENFLITFETNELKILSTLINNIKKQSLDIQSWGIDYLIYYIYNDILNNYYTVFDHVARELDNLEDEVLDNSGSESTYQKIATMRQSARLGRRNLQSIQSLLAILEYQNPPWLTQSVKTLFNQELVRHIDKLSQEYQTLRLWMSELMEIQRDNIASKTSERINRLTILSSVFLPITFIAGVYGMNFKYMPELELPWSYPAVLILMALIVIGSIMYAKQQRWL
ncbi:magnesium transporter CorA family protein [Chlorogloeopsis fritschii PCC 9212]|uniref:Magnesium transport protein CorA n=1 Tax=Chlorogloeopsis fritschii PCC 6912 TaxID=211165 RepID=A0A3S0ZRZ9_CHLFR|nr:CorA family divalent cation transporter [Chlorogloeopsis fritschii]RUR76182.1 magnesium transport protein CorA [Chlorogloeopsis fritschii PCC 6912]